MNRRRALTVVAAIVLTIVGMVIVIAYVRSAETRAQEGSELVPILVAAEEIPPETPAAELADSVVVREVPRGFVSEDAIQPQGLDRLEDLVTLERILAGEPIVARQFGDPAEARRGGGGQIEEGLEIVTVALEPQRALGGEVAPGDLVGVIVSLDSDSGAGGEDAATTTTSGEPAETAMVLAGVPVTAVSGAEPAATAAGAQGDTIMVSLQVDEPDAERIVFGAEFGRLWLTRQGEGEDTDSRTRTRENIFGGLGRN